MLVIISWTTRHFPKDPNHNIHLRENLYSPVVNSLILQSYGKVLHKASQGATSEAMRLRCDTGNLDRTYL